MNILKYIKYRLDSSNIIYSFGLLYLYKYKIFQKFLYPRVLAIFLTTKCNLNCFICSRGDYIGEDFDFNNLQKLENTIKYSKVIDLTGWGESMIYPRFVEVLQYIYSINQNKNLISITTNGTRLSSDIALLLNGHLHSLIISLNAATEETYNRDMRHGNFTKTLNSIKIFLNSLEEQERKKVILHFVAHTENYNEIPEFVKLSHELGIVSVVVGQYLITNKEHIKYSLINIKEEYNNIIDIAELTAKNLNISFIAPKFLNKKVIVNRGKCNYPFTECFIKQDGSVSPCCFSGVNYMGNVYNTSFEDVWFGEKYNKLRRNRFFESCKRCVPVISFDDSRAHLAEILKF